jgi:hypothetical protein
MTTARLPEYLPIVRERCARADYPAVYAEVERTAPADLCDASGRLNDAAVGWSRMPLVRANLRRHWPRKKRWNFWNWISPRFVFSVTLADIDYGAFCQASFIDFESGRSVQTMALTRPGSLTLPEVVDGSIAFRSRATEYSNAIEDDRAAVRFSARTATGERIEADFTVRRPPDHESLNIVVPWTPTRFQLNCKANTLPCDGHVSIGGTRYVMEPSSCHAVQDFGRGIWPYRAFWNWGVATGSARGRTIGVNVGGKWTTGTGVNENALCLDGRLHKIQEDLMWEYDPADWMRPWRVRAVHSEMLDLTLQPLVAHPVRVSLGVLSTRGVCCFGRWHGRLRAGGEEIAVADLIGWAEEFAHRW